MKANDTIHASTHADFLNQLLHINYKQYMKCTCKISDDCIIWLIRLDGKESKDGWTNSLSDTGNLIQEFYTGDPLARLYNHKHSDLTKKRLVFNIFDGQNGKRRYVFCGVFAYDTRSNNDYRVWQKIEDEYNF